MLATAILYCCAASGPAPGRNSVTAATRTESGNYAGAYLDFTTAEGEQVLAKIASGDSYESAQKPLETESPGWGFDAVKKRAEDAWAAKLNTIEVKGGTEKERMLFCQPAADCAQGPAVPRSGRPDAHRGSRSVRCLFGIPAEIRSCCSRWWNPR